tara:strand:+ start:310 stop:756 length:447 start_codon:yes stop_codon:yes gene_type:complete
MSITKIFLFLIIFFLQILSFSNVSYSEEASNEETEENINLEEEELPAIDPFQSSSAAGTSSASLDNNNLTQDMGILSGLKLVGVIIGKNKKIAVLASNEGFALKFQENDKINNNIELQEIYPEYLLIKDEQENFYEVYMNDVIKSVDG